MSKELKLKAELVPRTSWYSNMRSAFPTAVWDKIRKRIYVKYGNRCGICGAAGRLSCHEIWQYGKQVRVQKLKGFIALCDLCHHVKHIGLAEILASKGLLDYEKVIKHFMKVNKCSRAMFDFHVCEAFSIWSERSCHIWKIDLGSYEKSVLKVKKKRGKMVPRAKARGAPLALGFCIN